MRNAGNGGNCGMCGVFLQFAVMEISGDGLWVGRSACPTGNESAVQDVYYVYLSEKIFTNDSLYGNMVCRHILYCSSCFSFVLRMLFWFFISRLFCEIWIKGNCLCSGMFHAALYFIVFSRISSRVLVCKR